MHNTVQQCSSSLNTDYDLVVIGLVLMVLLCILWREAAKTI